MKTFCCLRRILLVLATLVANVGLADSQVGVPDSLQLSVGGNYGVSTWLKGLLINPIWNPYLNLDYEKCAFFANTQTGAGYKLFDTKSLNAGLALNYEVGRDASNDSRYAGLKDVPGRFAPSVFAESKPFGEILDLFFESGQTLEAKPKRYGLLEATLGVPLSRVCNGFIDILGQAANANSQRAYYGISPDQLAHSGYPVFRPGSGFTAATAVVGITYNYSPRWQLTVDAGALRYLGGAADSPITNYSVRATASAFLTFYAW